MEEIRILEMTEAHIPQVAAIEAEVFTCPWSQKGFSDTLYQDNVKFYVAMKDSSQGTAVAGYCGMYMAADEGEITNVAVKPEFRREHIGDALLEVMISVSEETGISRIYLEVRVSNEAAIRLYEKHGFARVGIRKNFYEKPREDAYVMCRESKPSRETETGENIKS